MKHMIKCTMLMSILIISMLTLFACGKKVADEEQIKLDLESNTEFQFLKNDYPFCYLCHVVTWVLL